MDFAQLANYAIEHKASDIHLSPGLPPLLRIYGDVKEIHVAPFRGDDIKNMLYGMMTESQKQFYISNLEVDFSISVANNVRLRVNAFNTINGPAAAFRLIPVEVKSLAQLGAPEVFESFTKFPRGLVLVTGPTGTGKSTTLAALINHINEQEAYHVITIEDPVEFIHKSKKSLVNQREVGPSTKSFASALKSALRQDPDVLLVGELRDLESISLALTAAETGQLVFATLHTSSAAKTIDRIVDVFPGNDKEMIRAMLSGSIQAVISQQLLKKQDGTGMVAAYEVLVATPAIKNMIRENKIPQISSLMQIGSKEGMCIMSDYVRSLYAQGIISRQEAGLAITDDEDEDSIIKRGGKTETKKTALDKVSKAKKSEESDF